MRIGEYETIGLLGKGGMSEVYEAEHVRLGSRRAIKIYAYGKNDPQVRRRFETEGLLLARLRHPRIVHVTDLGVLPDGRPYFVMDLVLAQDGRPKNLAEVGAGGADEETIGRWYDDIREGLAYIHGKGIIHRDLKLENVLIGPDGHAVLTDFGISRISEDEKGGKAVVDAAPTIVCAQDGKVPLMGSIGYLAPELEMGVAVSPQSDWYALGVIVYRLLTGEWCDARTDIVPVLETYEPVWTEILPALLHVNPAGRKCLAYAEVKSELVGRHEREMEDALEQVKGCACALSRRVKIAAGVAGLLGAFVALLSVWNVRLAERPRWEHVFSVSSLDATDEVDEDSLRQARREILMGDDVGNEEGIFDDLAKLSPAMALTLVKEKFEAARRSDEPAMTLVLSNAVMRLGGF